MAQQPSSPVQEITAFIKPKLGRHERRAEQRYRCRPTTLVRIRVHGTNIRRGAFAYNLSTGGVALHVWYPLEVGSALVLRLCARQPTGMISVPARVVEVTEQGDGSWRLSCAFDLQIDQTTLANLL